MDPARNIASGEADIPKIMVKLTNQVTKHVNNLQLLREEVAKVNGQQQTEESHLRDLLEERDKIVSEEQRANADQAVVSHGCEKKLGELEEEMNKHREAAIISEVYKKVLTALRELLAQKDKELAALRCEKQWTPGAELFCVPGGVSSDIVSQIARDVKKVSKEVNEVENRLRQLLCKRIEADKIVHKIRAYMETEKTTKLDMECRISAMRVNRRKEMEAALTASQQASQLLHIRPICLEAVSSLCQSRSAMLKELEEEKIRGGNLAKEISEVMQLAAKYAADRQDWLEKQFLEDSSDNGK